MPADHSDLRDIEWRGQVVGWLEADNGVVTRKYYWDAVGTLEKGRGRHLSH